MSWFKWFLDLFKEVDTNVISVKHKKLYRRITTNYKLVPTTFYSYECRIHTMLGNSFVVTWDDAFSLGDDFLARIQLQEYSKVDIMHSSIRMDWQTVSSEFKDEVKVAIWKAEIFFPRMGFEDCRDKIKETHNVWLKDETIARIELINKTPIATHDTLQYVNETIEEFEE